MALIEARDLTYGFGNGKEICFQGSFVIKGKERTVLLGANGSGKTTFLYMLLGLLYPTTGTVNLLGEAPALTPRILQRLGVVMQRADDQLVADTAVQDVALGLIGKGHERKLALEESQAMLTSLGIGHLAERHPRSLSGGEKKKIALAGALIHHPDILILDEPFAGLDPVSRQEMAELLISINEEMGAAILFTAHELDMVLRVARDAYLLADGTLHGPAPIAEVLTWDDRLQEARLEAPEIFSLKRFLERQGFDLGDGFGWPNMAARLLSHSARKR